MSIITLTTDLGIVDHRVPSIKGSILSLEPSVPIIDITHDIEPYNLIQTTYILKNTYHHFPVGSIHIIAVDSLYHKDRKFLVCKAEGHYFILPDNGIFSLMFQNIKPEKSYEITINNRFDDIVNFTPIDIFVPVAVHLFRGGIPEVIGREITEIKEIYFPKPNFNENENLLIGEVIYIDHFGNAITNINKDFFNRHFAGFENFKIKIRGYNLTKIVQKITDIIPNFEQEFDYHGNAAAMFNECNLLEIGIYKSNKNNSASSLMGLNIGTKIYIEFS